MSDPKYSKAVELAARLDSEIMKVKELKARYHEDGRLLDYIVLDYIEKILDKVRKGDGELSLFL